MRLVGRATTVARPRHTGSPPSRPCAAGGSRSSGRTRSSSSCPTRWSRGASKMRAAASLRSLTRREPASWSSSSIPTGPCSKLRRFCSSSTSTRARSRRCWCIAIASGRVTSAAERAKPSVRTPPSAELRVPSATSAPNGPLPRALTTITTPTKRASSTVATVSPKAYAAQPSAIRGTNVRGTAVSRPNAAQVTPASTATWTSSSHALPCRGTRPTTTTSVVSVSTDTAWVLSAPPRGVRVSGTDQPAAAMPTSTTTATRPARPAAPSTRDRSPGEPKAWDGPRCSSRAPAAAVVTAPTASTRATSTGSSERPAGAPSCPSTPRPSAGHQR